MTPEQRKAYNQKRYTPKRKRESGENGETGKRRRPEDVDALASLERDVIKRTQQVNIYFSHLPVIYFSFLFRAFSYN